ncbi:603_t:CDS:2 [Funneliformis geosporum]|nr:603_t:CDS:2 [Funneliformis geosporum]
MSKFFSLKPNKIKELVEAAKPVDIKKLKTELKKKKKELEKMGKKKVIENSKAIRFLMDYNKNFVKYLAKGYSSFNKKIDPEELVSEGISSLPKAIEKFNPDCGSSENKEKKNVVYYDNSYQNDDKENKSYSLLETLHDEENVELTAEQIRHRDAVIQTNNLINTLEDREAILLIRLLSGVKPSNLLDIYYLATEEEKGELKKKMKLGNKFNPELLQKNSLEEKKFQNLPLVKKYLSLFAKSYNFSEASKTLGKSENMARRLKQESFKKLQKLAKERNLNLLI